MNVLERDEQYVEDDSVGKMRTVKGKVSSSCLLDVFSLALSSIWLSETGFTIPLLSDNDVPVSQQNNGDTGRFDQDTFCLIWFFCSYGLG